MLVKEYRIPMPMSVDEYRIAQLYMIQKKSREESCGEGSGVEILENKPYEDGPGGTGQYTHKVYTCPFVEKFSIDIETYYKPDTDPIDIVTDYIPPHEYLAEEDPKLYQSLKTRRGPLSDDWIQEINQNPGQNPVMCAYKLCKVEFRYWGMQSKIERFIHDVGLRKVMVRAHRQAWCWQDEWYGLTIEDIRQLELETQLALARKMAQYSLTEEGSGGQVADASSSSSHHHQHHHHQEQGQENQEPGAAAAQEVDGSGGREAGEARGELTKQWSTSSRSSNRSSKRGGSPSHQSISEWRMQSIARDSDDSTDDDEMGCLQSSKTHVLILVLHGGTILDSGSVDQSSKQGDVNTLAGAFETVMRVHYPSALGHLAVRLGCLSSSQDHIPLAALPLLATSAPQYQDAVATVILRANQVYADFIKSLEGASFSGQDPKKQLPRKRSDSSTYELDTIKQHQAFLSRSPTSSCSAPRWAWCWPSGRPWCPLWMCRRCGRPASRCTTCSTPRTPRPRAWSPCWANASTCCPPEVIHSHCGGGLSVDSPYPSSPLFGAPALRGHRRASEASIASQVSGMADSYTASNIATIASHWWGSKRIDFALYCPDALTAFPTVALPHLFHASYWESTDVVAFILRQVMRHENASILELDGKEVSEFTPSKPREKWLRKRTQVKIRNVTANHRVCDAVFSEDGAQLVTGRFMYGPPGYGHPHRGARIDIHIMTQPPSGEWVYFDTEADQQQRQGLLHPSPTARDSASGSTLSRWWFGADHTSADSYLTSVATGRQSCGSSSSRRLVRAPACPIMGQRTPKLSSPVVPRHWQDLGYLIVYVTGRPDMQKQRVVAWLSQHNFPHGIVSFCEGLVHDPLRHKANFLKSLICEAHMKIFAAYGSTKDISVYSSIGLSPSHIYIVGRATKKMLHHCQFIPDGYASHLAQLEYNQRSRPAKAASARMVLRKGSFGLGAAGGDFLRKRNHVFRTLSSQPGAAGGGNAASGTAGAVGTTTAAGGGALGRTERTQSQCEVDRGMPSAVASTAQRSMSIAAGCWGRSGSTKEGSGGLLSPK
ncbi:hypothetical protein CRUP_003769 [Coryphaenoides rupestris]|nr:hypothetical protein CRUP_003769 [Coryphaenoides rupestris]